MVLYRGWFFWWLVHYGPDFTAIGLGSLHIGRGVVD